MKGTADASPRTWMQSLTAGMPSISASVHGAVKHRCAASMRTLVDNAFMVKLNKLFLFLGLHADV